MLTSAGIKLKIVVNVKMSMLGSTILRVKPVVLVIENSLKCHCTFFYVQTFRAEPFISVKKAHCDKLAYAIRKN